MSAAVVEQIERNGETISVGDFFASSWGYDQTNIDFYKVVGLTPKGVRLQHWSSRLVDENRNITQAANRTVSNKPGPTPAMTAPLTAAFEPSSRSGAVGERDEEREERLGAARDDPEATVEASVVETLDDAAKVEIVAYILQTNGYPAGARELVAGNELAADRRPRAGGQPLGSGLAVRRVRSDAWSKRDIASTGTISRFRVEMPAEGVTPAGRCGQR